MYNITHIFDVDGGKYALDFRNIFFCQLDKKTESELNGYLTVDGQISDDYAFGTALDAAVRHGFFISNHPDEPIPLFDYDTLNISFAPVHDCNFSCAYCYAEGGKGTASYQRSFDKDMIDAMLNYIYVTKYSNYQKYKFDFVSGGEPLLNLDILEYFLKQVRIFDWKYNKKTAILIVTNGSLLTSEIIKKLDKYDVYLGISIDGRRHIHNLHRVYKNGIGTYDDVVAAITNLRASSASFKLKDAWAMSVITPKTGNLVDLMEHCMELGFKRMQMQLLRVPNNHHLRFHDLTSLKNKYKELFAYILLCAEKGNLDPLKMIANDNDSFGKFIARLILRKKVCYRCFAGKNKIAITADGIVFPCDSFCGDSKFAMDSIINPAENESVREEFQCAHIQHREKCSTCWARFLCGGDCYYNSFVINGNIYDPDPFICEMNRFFIEYAIYMIMRLYEVDKKNIDYMARLLSVNSYL